MTLRSLLLCAAVVHAAVSWSEPAAADIEVLLKSGDTAPDGRILSGFSSPTASSKKIAAFLGTTSAIITKSGSTFAAVAKTGDPLPAPLTGTFNTFADPVINDAGNVAFRASLNSPNADSGLFYCCDAGAIVPIGLTGGTSGQAVTISNPPDMNNNSDVVYERGTDDIYLWSLGTLTSVLLASDGTAAPGGGTFNRFGDRPVVNDSQVVAFEGEVSGGPEGIFVTAPPFSTIEACALEDAATPIGGTFKIFATNAAVAINTFGYVAFTAGVAIPGPDTSAVFACDSSGPTLSTVAQEGDLVSGTPLSSIDDEFVGIDDAFNVAFEGTAAGRQLVLASGGLTALTPLASSAAEFAPRLTAGGRVIWRRTGRIERFDGAITTVVGQPDLTPIGLAISPREPSINNLDDMVFRATQSVLYVLDDGNLEVVAAPGGPSPGVGTYGAVRSPVFRGSSLAFAAADSGGELIALKRGHGAVTQVLHSGDLVPGGGTFDLGSSALAVSGSKVLFHSFLSGTLATEGLFRVNTQSGRIDTLALEDDPAPAGGVFEDFLAVYPAGNDAVFISTLDSSFSGIFLTSRSGPIQVVLEGDALPDTGGGTLSRLGGVAVKGKRVVFTGEVSGGTVSDGLFVWSHGRITRLVSAGDPAGVGNTFSTVFSSGIVDGVIAPLALTSSPVLVASLSGANSEGLLFVRSATSVVPVAYAGDPTPLGGTVSGFNLGEPISRIGNSVILEAGFSASSGVALALVRAEP